MVDSLKFCQFSSKMLFHNIAMFEPSRTIYVNTKIAKFRKAWSSFFKISPFWRDVVISVPVESSSVHLANTSFCLFKDIATTFDFAYFVYHKLHYNGRGSICQV